MTRNEAKAVLVASGVAEPSEEQISNLLDSVTAETKKEKERADKLKEKADKADELQKQLDEAAEKDMTEADKASKALEEANKKIAELTSNSLRSEAKGILKGSGLDDEAIEALLPGMIADTLENTQTRANAFVSTIGKVRETAVKESKKDALNNTKKPDGNGSGEEKTDDVVLAESVAASFGTGAKESADAFKNY